MEGVVENKVIEDTRSSCALAAIAEMEVKAVGTLDKNMEGWEQHRVTSVGTEGAKGSWATIVGSNPKAPMAPDQTARDRGNKQIRK